LLLLLVASATAAAALTYTLDSAHSAPAFSFSHLGLTTQSGRFDRAHGLVVLDIAARKGRVSYEVDAGSIDMGFGTETADSPGPRLLDALRHPTIRYESDRLEFDRRGRVIGARGQLTLLGVTRPLSLKVEHFRCSTSPMTHKPMCAADITAVILRSAFGMMDYLPAIGDEVTVRIPVEAYRD
jgi:polyisoprenoid-binding protein YceI